MNKTRRPVRTAPIIEGLEVRQLLTAPVIDPIRGVSVPAGEILVPANKTRVVPLSASDADGDPLSYAAVSDRGDVSATILRGGPYLRLSIAGKGDMTFQLLPNFAPNTVATITQLVDAGFYNGLKIHRIVPNSVIQGGDPNGDGTGGPGFRFDDEFDPKAIFSGDGQLAMANSGKDINGSQFFVTLGAQRFLDFNHTIWGQLLRGFDVLKDINDDPNSGSLRNAPTTPIVITSASIIPNTTDAVLLLESKASGFGNVTITANDGTPGGQATTTIRAVIAADPTNDPAILGPVANQVTAANTPITFPLSGIDPEGDNLTFAVDNLDGQANSAITVAGNAVTVTPAPGYRGEIRLRAKVKQANATSRGSSIDPFDTQVFTVTVKDQSLTAQGVETTGVAGTSVQPLVARLTTAVPFTASTYTATIDWGDGTRSDGTVAGSSGSYEVFGTKSYVRSGSYPIAVTIRDAATGIAVAATSKATIADATLTAVFAPLQAIPGTSQVNGPIATFTSSNTGAILDDLTATIAWGDGTSTRGTITGGNGSYAVYGTKTYFRPGTFPVTVTVQNAGGASAVAQGELTIPNRAPTLVEIPDKTVTAGSTLAFVASGIEIDAGQSLIYRLGSGAPEGATIDPATGAFSWTPSTGPTTASITVVVTDNGSPALSAARTFAVDVRYVAPLVRVLSTSLTRKKRAITAIRVQLDGAIDPSTLGAFSDIALVSPGRDRKLGTRDDVAGRFRSKSFDPASRSLTLVPSKKLTAKGAIRLRINGVTDASGRAIDSDGDGVPGGPLLTISAKTGGLIRS